MRSAALRRCVLGVGGGLGLPVVLFVILIASHLDVVVVPLVISALVGPFVAATALVKHGEVAWRYRTVRAGVTVERFAGCALIGFEDTVTKRLRKRKLIEGERHHVLLVAPRSGILLAVDDTASPHAVRGTIAETAALRSEEELGRALSGLELAELAGVIDRMYKLPVAGSFALGWIATVVLRALVLPNAAMLKWFNTQGWMVWFGIAGVLLVLAQLYAWLRIAALRSELGGPLHVVTVEDPEAPSGTFSVAGFAQSGVVWQYGQYPGPARLEGGGLLSKVARKARG